MFNNLHFRLVKMAPSLLRIPTEMIPFPLKKQVIERLLHLQFHQALAEGELDFLEGRWLRIDVRDLGLRWFTSVKENTLTVQSSAEADVTFSADANDLLLIAAGRQDPDTLFFQRRLTIEGDTELGLYVKNAMDAIELDTMPKPLRMALLQWANFVEAGLHKAPVPDDDSIGELC